MRIVTVLGVWLAAVGNLQGQNQIGHVITARGTWVDQSQKGESTLRHMSCVYEGSRIVRKSTASTDSLVYNVLGKVVTIKCQTPKSCLQPLTPQPSSGRAVAADSIIGRLYHLLLERPGAVMGATRAGIPPLREAVLALRINRNDPAKTLVEIRPALGVALAPEDRIRFCPMNDKGVVTCKGDLTEASMPCAPDTTGWCGSPLMPGLYGIDLFHLHNGIPFLEDESLAFVLVATEEAVAGLRDRFASERQAVARWTGNLDAHDARALLRAAILGLQP